MTIAFSINKIPESIWNDSFKEVNLYYHNILRFNVWIKKSFCTVNSG